MAQEEARQAEQVGADGAVAETAALENAPPETGASVEGALEGATDGALTDALASGGATDMVTQALELLDIGGPVVAILAALSVFALAIVLAKLWQFSQARMSEAASARRAVALFATGRGGEAMAELERLRGAAAEPLRLAVQGRLTGVEDAKLRERAYLAAADGAEALRSWLRPLEAIATLSPLLGLLGTVLGMIAAFAALEAAGSQVDPAILSGGIWEALLTTAVGLAVAIPATAALNWFDRRIERYEHEMEQLLGAVFSAGEASPASAYANDALRDEAYARPDRFYATAGE